MTQLNNKFAPAEAASHRAVWRRVALALIVVLITAGCASKSNRTYTGQCAVDGHWFCGKVYETFSECNRGRIKHDYETAGSGSCG